MKRSSKRFPSSSGPARRLRITDSRGVAAVEFALILPFFLTLVLGMIDYGYFFFVDLTVTNAAREGAREGAIQTSPGEASSAATTAANNYLGLAGLTDDQGLNYAAVTITEPVEDTADSPIIVQISVAEFTPLVGFLPANLFPQTLSVTSQMRWEMAP